MDQDLSEACNSMLTELQRDERFLPSEFWVDLNRKNVAMLEEDGIVNFKRTVSQNYYNWMVEFKSPMFRRAFKDWIKHLTFWPLLTIIEHNIRLRFYTRPDTVKLTFAKSQIYKFFVSFVWEIMIRNDKAGFRKLVKESLVGNPIKIWRGRSLISQDLANSILEANEIADLLKEVRARPRIAEIGAGYGRLAYVLSSSKSGAYFIFDIPPALYVSQWYLTNILPEKRFFKFQSFETFSEIEDELNQCDVAFFTANQLQKFPDSYFDIVLSISTLPEMRPEQVELYLECFQRLARTHIYLKQWKSWKNPVDGTDIKVEDYLLSSEWTLIKDQTDLIVPEFFSRVWRRAASIKAPLTY
jgi:putative sugar O-methyltransferase